MPWAPTRRVDRDAFYTRRAVVDACVAAIERRAWLRVRDGDTLVDVACGDNYFAARMRAVAAPRTLRVVAYDVEPAAACFARECVVRGDFLRVPRANGDGARTVLGFNLPFGRNGELLRRLVDHALDVYARPRALYLVHPRRGYCPRGYAVAYQHPLARYSFMRPDTGRAFAASGCVFSVFVRAAERAQPTLTGVAERARRDDNAVCRISQAAAALASAVLAVLRVGSRAGRVVVVRSSGRMFVDGARDEREPTPPDADLASTMYLKVAFDARNVDVERVAAHVSRLAALDPHRRATALPALTLPHARRTVHALLAAERAGRAPPRTLDGDIRAFAVRRCALPPAPLSACRVRVGERAPRLHVGDTTATALAERAPRLHAENSLQ